MQAPVSDDPALLRIVRAASSGGRIWHMMHPGLAPNDAHGNRRLDRILPERDVPGVYGLGVIQLYLGQFLQLLYPRVCGTCYSQYRHCTVPGGVQTV